MTGCGTTNKATHRRPVIHPVEHRLKVVELRA
jgi:hypothetical protein